MNDNTLKSGSLLQGGKYRITGVLGKGGFGITYEAEQVSLGRKVAVKEFFMKDYCDREDGSSHVTLGTSSSSRELVDRFRTKFVREAKMIAALDHEHIVKIHDVFEENGTAYYVMEYLDGGSVDKQIREKGAMPEVKALGYIRKVADALSYLHSQNILHFDVKPSNILLGKNGKAKLIDFGISKHYDEAGVQTSSTPVGISKGFAPLEQYKQGSDLKSFTPATDIYALGATLYAMLSGSNPPEASDVNDDGLPIIDGVSPNVMRAVEKAMQPRRKDRPQSVEEFLKLLDGPVADDDEETVVPASNPVSTPKPNLEAKPSPAPTSKSAPNPKSGRVWKWLLGVLEVSACLFGAFCIVASLRLFGSWQLISVILIAAMLLCAWLLKISVIRPSGEKLHKYNRVLKKSCIGFFPCLLACGFWFFFPSDKIGTIEYVDLGLSVKWATCNIGAASPEDSGNYYAWGETKTKRLFLEYTYKCNRYDDTDGRQELLLSDDVAHIKWGGNWRMPTEAEFQELKDKCIWTWTTLNGKNGYKVVSKSNGNSIFLPAAGWRGGTSLYLAGSDGHYWSGSLYESNFSCAHSLWFSSDVHLASGNGRDVGRSVRPVLH